MLEKKSIYKKCLFLSHIFFPGVTNLDLQIRCAQNRYTAVQTDLKYPLIIFKRIWKAYL